MSSELETAILTAEKRRCDAMLANDGKLLGELLDARLHFAHSSGAVDGKDAILTKMAAGRIVYQSVTWSEENITELGPEAAMLTGRMIADVRVEGKEKRLDNRVITIWRKPAEQWRLIAFQSTPLPV